MFYNSEKQGVKDMDYSSEPRGVYMLVDNKSFYASVEAVERGLNPLKAVLIVMSETANTGTGLVLASSPRAKKEFGIRNVDREYQIPHSSKLLVVPPRMNLYIDKNLAINDIFKRFANEVCPYSIDESILDLTDTWRLFGETPLAVAKKIQRTIRHELGLYTTIGIGENPLQAKLALDLIAKHDRDLVGTLCYQSFPREIWPITDLTSVWSIGDRTANHLHRLGIQSMGDLAHADPYELKAEMGIIGTQLYALSWGIDRSRLTATVPVKDKSWSNSQVLPRDYRVQEEIELVIKEIGEQVTSRMRHHGQAASRISLAIGYSAAQVQQSGSWGFAHDHSLSSPSADSRVLVAELLAIFRKYWNGETVRDVMVAFSKLSPHKGQQLSLLQPIHQQVKSYRANEVIDDLRDRFGPTALVYASSLKRGGTMIARAGLVGGHNGGNALS